MAVVIHGGESTKSHFDAQTEKRMDELVDFIRDNGGSLPLITRPFHASTMRFVKDLFSTLKASNDPKQRILAMLRRIEDEYASMIEEQKINTDTVSLRV